MKRIAIKDIYAGMPDGKAGVIYTFRSPLSPSLTEQKHIVAKLEENLPLCMKLK